MDEAEIAALEEKARQFRAGIDRIRANWARLKIHERLAIYDLKEQLHAIYTKLIHPGNVVLHKVAVDTFHLGRGSDRTLITETLKQRGYLFEIDIDKQQIRFWRQIDPSVDRPPREFDVVEVTGSGTSQTVQPTETKTSKLIKESVKGGLKKGPVQAEFKLRQGGRKALGGQLATEDWIKDLATRAKVEHVGVTGTNIVDGKTHYVKITPNNLKKSFVSTYQAPGNDLFASSRAAASSSGATKALTAAQPPASPRGKRNRGTASKGTAAPATAGKLSPTQRGLQKGVVAPGMAAPASAKPAKHPAAKPAKGPAPSPVGDPSIASKMNGRVQRGVAPGTKPKAAAAKLARKPSPSKPKPAAPVTTKPASPPAKPSAAKPAAAKPSVPKPASPAKPAPARKPLVSAKPATQTPQGNPGLHGGKPTATQRGSSSKPFAGRPSPGIRGRVGGMVRGRGGGIAQGVALLLSFVLPNPFAGRDERRAAADWKEKVEPKVQADLNTFFREAGGLEHWINYVLEHEPLGKLYANVTYRTTDDWSMDLEDGYFVQYWDTTYIGVTVSRTKADARGEISREQIAIGTWHEHHVYTTGLELADVGAIVHDEIQDILRELVRIGEEWREIADVVEPELLKAINALAQAAAVAVYRVEFATGDALRQARGYLSFTSAMKAKKNEPLRWLANEVDEQSSRLEELIALFDNSIAARMAEAAATPAAARP
jgi:hypothetical protein